MSQPTASRDPAILIDAPLNHGGERHLADDALDGLTRPFKELPPKHFYDSRGSELFERICALPEYYPTRTELAILRTRADEIIADAGEPAELVELGCGSTVKARLLLDAMTSNDGAARYVPLDVSERVVVEAAEALTDAYPGLQVHGVVGDFERHLDRLPPPRPNGAGRLVAFLGGTIGNFPPGSRRRMLRDIAGLLGPGDHLVLGTDLVKDPAVIEAAYNDPDGVTAEFNRNVLHVMNRELGANFEPGAFDHVAFFDRRREWVEMRLRAQRSCTVRIADLDLEVEFGAGEELRTEISAKFTRERLTGDYASAGLELRGWYTDPDELFVVTLARRSG
jgi:L-histidine N-alpha-methyltransferase